MRRLIATVPIGGDPDGERLGDIETVYELDGWRHVTVVAQPVDDAATRWEAKVFADDPTTEQRCSGCGGILIGSETEHGTCGHCGHRSLTPEPAPAKHARLTVGEGLLAIAGGWGIGIALGIGVLLAAALGAAASWLAAYAGGWARLIVATGAVTAVAALVRAVADPKVMR